MSDESEHDEPASEGETGPSGAGGPRAPLVLIRSGSDGSTLGTLLLDERGRVVVRGSRTRA